MLLALDVGNTNVTLGILKPRTETAKAGRLSRLGFSSGAKSPPQVLASWRLATSTSATADEYGTKLLDLLHYASIERSQIKGVAVANVVPALSYVFEQVCQKYLNLKPFIIGQGSKSPIPNLYENPREVGADRIANAVAAHARFGGPTIVVDFGTATTFDCVTRKGEYAGGVIVPGPVLAAESLALHTAKLPKVEMARPSRVIGKNTVESIQSGLYYGYIDLVDGVLDRLSGELGMRTKIAATGGLAPLLAQDSRHIKKDSIVPELTLEGICLIYEKNSQ
jgi:type III pantothenate kinase